jgi:raffinose/stachyose/melibiose transport system permease protein
MTAWIIIFLAPSVLLFTAIYLVPLLTVVVSSFTRWNGFTKMKVIGLANYLELFGDPSFIKSITNTLIWALAALSIHVPFGVIVALVLNRRQRGWRFTRAVFMLPNIISPTAMAILFVFVYKPDIGILNSILQNFSPGFSVNWLFDDRTAFLSVTMVWLFYAAVITLITLSELIAIPNDLRESALIDGATDLQIDLYIHLPLIRKIIGTGVIIAVTAVFKKFDIIYLTTNGGPGNATMTMSVMMVNNIVMSNRYGYANAIGTLLLAMGIGSMLLATSAFKLGQSSYH